MRRPAALFPAAAIACLVAVACGEAGPVTGSFTLSGTVTDGRKAGLAIPGATVRLEHGPATATTDSLGRYRLAGVPGGDVEDALILAENSSNTLRYYDLVTGELLRTTAARSAGGGGDVRRAGGRA